MFSQTLFFVDLLDSVSLRAAMSVEIRLSKPCESRTHTESCCYIWWVISI